MPGDGKQMVVEGCTVSGNKLNGLLVRDGATPRLLRNIITGNGTYGVVLQVCLCSGDAASTRTTAAS